MIFPEWIEGIEENFPKLKMSKAKLTSFLLQKFETRRKSNSSQSFRSFLVHILTGSFESRLFTAS